MRGAYVSFRKTAAWTVRITDSSASFVVVGIALFDVGQFAGIHGLDSVRAFLNENCLVDCLANNELLPDKFVVDLWRS